jgi:hypothetical protein
MGKRISGPRSDSGRHSNCALKWGDCQLTSDVYDMPRALGGKRLVVLVGTEEGRRHHGTKRLRAAEVVEGCALVHPSYDDFARRTSV